MQTSLFYQGLRLTIKSGEVIHNIYFRETILGLMVVNEVYNIEGVGSSLLDGCGFGVTTVSFIKWNRNWFPDFLHYFWVEVIRQKN